jgi:hypothetical protein
MFRRCLPAIVILLAAPFSAGGAPPAGATKLAASGSQFTIDGRPTFLLGISYYGALGASRAAIARDLDDCQRFGFNWLRVWETWEAWDDDVSAVNSDGGARQPYLKKLAWLVGECDRRAMIVDVTLTRGAALPTQVAHLAAVRTIIGALREYSNWYLDLANERNIHDARYVSIEELRELREQARRLAPGLLVTASHAGDIDAKELEEYLGEGHLDFIAPHRPRDASSPAQTADAARRTLAASARLGRSVPVHYQEPFRRGYDPRHWDPRARDFLTDLQGARAGGAAGWCLHNGGQREAPDQQPRRCFDMRRRRLFEQLDAEERAFLTLLGGAGGESSLPASPRA